MTSTPKPSSKKTPRSSGPAGPSYPAPIQDTALNAAQRERALEEMSSAEGLDVLVVGGGVTGAGIALDAAARGLRTLAYVNTCSAVAHRHSGKQRPR